MTADRGLAGEAHLELSVGDPDAGDLPEVPEGHIRVLSSDYRGEVSDNDLVRYALGALVLVVALGGVYLAIRSERLIPEIPLTPQR